MLKWYSELNSEHAAFAAIVVIVLGATAIGCLTHLASLAIAGRVPVAPFNPIQECFEPGRADVARSEMCRELARKYQP